jgi:HEAT repeat protein
MKTILVGVALCFCLSADNLLAQGAGQTRDRATPPSNAAAANADVSTLARGWTALEAGQFANAARAADAILRRRPWDRAALTLRITAMSSAAPLNGLDAYEQWIAAKHKDDSGLLEPVAIAVLQEIAKGSDPTHRQAALTALATAQVAGAREALDAALASRPQSQMDVAADGDAASRGDTAAVGRLNAAAANPAGASVDLVRALEQIGSSGEAGLVMLVNGGSPPVRAAAIRALGAMKSDRAPSLLQPFFDGMDPATRIPATIALAQLGDTRALARVDQMLATNVPQVQLEAAEAWGGRPGPWVEVVRPLLDNTDGFIRLDAARAIAPIDPEAAKRTLNTALGDVNPVIRYESAKSIGTLIETQPDLADLPILRQRLRDADRGVRVAVASALLKAARQF